MRQIDVQGGKIERTGDDSYKVTISVDGLARHMIQPVLDELRQVVGPAITRACTSGGAQVVAGQVIERRVMVDGEH